MWMVRVITATFLFFSLVSAYDPWEYKSMALRVMRFVSHGVVVTPRACSQKRTKNISVYQIFQPDGLGGHGEAPGNI